MIILIFNICVLSHSHVQLFATPWTITRQAPLSMEFSRQEYWIGEPFPSPGDLPNLGSNLGLLHCRQILYHLSYQHNLAKILPQNILFQMYSIVLFDTVISVQILPFCDGRGIVFIFLSCGEENIKLILMKPYY